MDTAIFETFGKYKLTERLAFGGMAEVFLATVHGEAGFIKPVVIKRLHPRLNEDAEFVQMLIDEARITAQLTHTNVCQVLDLGSVDNSYYLAMEFISGEDVRTVQDHCIRTGHALAIESAVFIVCEALAGLDYAHRKEDPDGQPMGIIHRDISPQNILISYEGEVKIIDFGIAKARTRMVQTEAGVIKGKFRYMSPEQASGGQIDHRTDVFAAGVVLYELLSGKPHSLDVADTEVLRRMRRAQFEPLRNHRSDIPPTLEKLVKKALAVKPSGRFASAGEFRDALLGFLERMGVRYGRSELSGIMKEIFDQDRRRRRSGSFSGVRVAQRDGGLATPHVEQHHVPTVTTSKETSVPGKRADGWVAFAPTNAMPDTGELPATSPLDALSTEAMDALPTRETEMPPMSHDAAESERQPSAPYGDDAATQAWYSLSDSDIVQDSQSVPTAQRSRPGVSQPQVDSQSVPTAQRSRPGVRRQGDLHRQPTDILDGGDAVEDEGPTHATADPYRSQRAGSDQPTQAPGPPRDPPHLGAPAHGDGFFAQRAETVAGRAEDYLRGPEQKKSRPPLPLRTLVGIGAVVMAGLILALVLVLVDRPLEIEEPGGHVGQPDYGLRVGVKDQGAEAPSMARINVRSQPPGAAIILCGVDTDQVTPAEVLATAGRTCDLELELDGYDSYHMELTPEPGPPIRIVAALRRKSRGGRQPRRRHGGTRRVRRSLKGKGILRVTSIQVGSVYVNNKRAGSTPRLDVKLAPGTYMVKVFFANLGRYSRTHSVQIAAGKTSRVHVEP